jgi:sec-independent protein translocase protein TatC
MFSIGILINYFILFPLTVKFLGTYQVSDDINNMLTISSYIDTLINMSLVIGIIFELPVVCWMLASFGILKAEWMKKFRRHSIVAILVLSAIITPTTDMFTLIVVSLPIWLLYELSVVIVSKTNKSRQNV